MAGYFNLVSRCADCQHEGCLSALKTALVNIHPKNEENLRQLLCILDACPRISLRHSYTGTLTKDLAFVIERVAHDQSHMYSQVVGEFLHHLVRECSVEMQRHFLFASERVFDQFINPLSRSIVFNFTEMQVHDLCSRGCYAFPCCGTSDGKCEHEKIECYLTQEPVYKEEAITKVVALLQCVCRLLQDLQHMEKTLNHLKEVVFPQMPLESICDVVQCWIDLDPGSPELRTHVLNAVQEELRMGTCTSQVKAAVSIPGVASLLQPCCSKLVELTTRAAMTRHSLTECLVSLSTSVLAHSRDRVLSSIDLPIKVLMPMNSGPEFCASVLKSSCQDWDRVARALSNIISLNTNPAKKQRQLDGSPISRLSRPAPIEQMCPHDEAVLSLVSSLLEEFTSSSDECLGSFFMQLVDEVGGLSKTTPSISSIAVDWDTLEWREKIKKRDLIGMVGSCCANQCVQANAVVVLRLLLKPDKTDWVADYLKDQWEMMASGRLTGSKVQVKLAVQSLARLWVSLEAIKEVALDDSLEIALVTGPICPCCESPVNVNECKKCWKIQIAQRLMPGTMINPTEVKQYRFPCRKGKISVITFKKSFYQSVLDLFQHLLIEIQPLECHSFLLKSELQHAFLTLKESVKTLPLSDLSQLLTTVIDGLTLPRLFQHLIAKHIASKVMFRIDNWPAELDIEQALPCLKQNTVSSLFPTSKELLTLLVKASSLPLEKSYRRYVLKAFKCVSQAFHLPSAKLMLALPTGLLYYLLGKEEGNFLCFLQRETPEENAHISNQVLAKAFADPENSASAVLALYYRLMRQTGKHTVHVESLLAEVAWEERDFSLLEEVFQRLKYPRANLLEYIRQKGDIVRMRAVVQLVYHYGLPDDTKAVWLLSELTGLPKPTDWLATTFSSISIHIAQQKLQHLHAFFKETKASLWEETIKVAFGFEDALRENPALKSANKLVAISRLLLSLPTHPFSTLKLVSVAVHLQFVDMGLALLCVHNLVTVAPWDDLVPHLDVLLTLALEGRNCTQSLPLLNLILKKCKKGDIEQLTTLDLVHGYAKLKHLTLTKPLHSEMPLWKAVANGVTSDVFQVQRTSIGLIIEFGSLLSEEERLDLLFALASVGQRNSSLEALKEHLYDIETRIAEAYGRLGAMSPSQLPIRPMKMKSRKDDVSSLIMGYMDSYMQVENTYLSYLRYQIVTNRLTEEEARIQGLELLSSLVVIKEVKQPNPAFGQEGLLRSWCAWIIDTQAQPSYRSLLPVIEVSLDCTAKTLQLLLGEALQRHGLFLEDTIHFLHELLQYAGISTKGIAIKALEQVISTDGSCVLSLVDPHLLVRCYCELLEFPKALYWLELQIRKRFADAQLRMKSSELTDEEFKSIQLVYSQLKENCYLREVPASVDYCPQTQSEEVILVQSRIFADVLDRGAFERVSCADWLQTLEKIDGGSHPLTRKKLLEHISGCLWRQGEFDTIASLVSRWERDMVTLECIVAQIVLAHHQSSNILSAVHRGKELSSHMCNLNAEYPQAYDYVFLQHILEDGRLLAAGEVNTVLDRHHLLRPEFRYLELSLRFSMALCENIDLKVPLAFTLVKTALRHRKREVTFTQYARLLLQDLCCSSVMLSDLRLVSYEMKLRLGDENALPFLKQRLERFLQGLPKDQLQLRYKCNVLLLKVICRLTWDMSLTTVKALRDQYLSPGEKEIKTVGVYMERGLYVLASHIDKFLLNQKIGQQDLRAHSCLLYFQSLHYSQRKALTSVPRALSLFFSANDEGTEGPELQRLNKATSGFPGTLPIVIWCHVLEQLLAHATHSKECCRNFVFAVSCNLMQVHAAQMAWYVLPMLFSTQERAVFAKRVLAALRAEVSAETYGRIEASVNVLKAITDLAKDGNARRIPANLLSDQRCNLALPIQPNFDISSQGFPSNPVLLIRFEQYLEVIESKARPKKVKLLGSDGVSRLFLCKFEAAGDMRKEARIATLIRLVNKLLRKHPKASELDLRLPSFCLLAISPMCAVIEWVSQTSTLRSVILKYWKREGFNFDISQIDKQLKSQGIVKTWDMIMSKIRPQLHKHFFETCVDGNSWHESRIRYTRSLAAWSIFGYIIGLGDRHCDNILLLDTGELMFIDFDCVFDMGRMLKVPELVPFRLTQELVDGLGLFGEAGEYLHACEIMLEALKSMSAELSSAFESFIHDPLVVSIKNPEVSRSDVDINNTLAIVVSRLKGQRSVSDQTLYPSARMQVQELVAKAKDEETLKRMFPGWMPWM